MAKTPLRPAPPPLEANDVAIVTGGTIVWFALFLLSLPFYGWFSDHDREWMVWTCLAGAVLGLIGIWYVRGRRDAIQRHREQEAAQAAQGPAVQAAEAGQAGEAALGPEAARTAQGPEPGAGERDAGGAGSGA